MKAIKKIVSKVRQGRNHLPTISSLLFSVLVIVASVAVAPVLPPVSVAYACTVSTMVQCGSADGEPTRVAPSALCLGGNTNTPVPVLDWSGTSYSWTCEDRFLGPGTGLACAGYVEVCSAPIIIDGACGGAVNTCTAGTLNDVPDSGVNYLWNCDSNYPGFYGGVNASCSSPISTCSNYWEVPDVAMSYTPIDRCSNMGISIGGCCDVYGAGTDVYCSRTQHTPPFPVWSTDYATCGPSATTQCSDGADNDSDGATDFPSDPGCVNPSDNDETNALPSCNWNLNRVLAGNACSGAQKSTSATYCNTANPVGAHPGWMQSDLVSLIPNPTSGMTASCVECMPSGPDDIYQYDVICGGGLPVVNGSCGAVNNACLSGTLNDIADNSTSYLWNCAGSNGGLTDPCSLPIPVPNLTITPDPVAFGVVPTGPTGVTRSFTIWNSGGVAFNGSISFPNNGAYESYDCGGNGVNILAGSSQTKTCTLRTTLAASLGGVAVISGGSYSQTFTVTATADTNTRIEVTPVFTGSPIVGATYNVPAITPSVGSGALQYDFEIRNIGSSVMNYTVSIQGGATPGFSTSGACAGSLSGSAVNVCRVTFNPATQGPINATIVFDNQSPPVAGSDPVSVNFTGVVTTNPNVDVVSGSAPWVSPVPGGFEYDFGPQVIGVPVTRTIYIANTGTGNLGGNLSGPSGVPFSASPSSGPINIIPGMLNALPVTVTFNAQGVAAVSDTITITGTNAQNFPGGTFTITVRGSGLAVPILTVTPQSQGSINWTDATGGATNMTFNLQEVYLGPIESRIVTIDNTLGSAPSTISISSNNSEFSVSTNSLTIPAGTSRNFTITFDPSAPVPPTTRSGVITLDANNLTANFTITVQGDADVLPPAITVTPTPIDFSKVLVGKTKQMTVTVHSTDSRTIDFGSVGAVLGNAVFTCVSANCFVPFQMNSGDTQVFTVQFTPLSIGVYTGSMIIPITTASIPALPIIPVTGTGARPIIKYEEN